MRIRRRAARLLALGMLWAAVWMPGPWSAALSEAPEAVIALIDGEAAELTLDDAPVAYRFTAPSNSVYDVWVFPAEEETPEVRAELWMDGELLAEGEGGMPALSLRLIAGGAYTLKLSGSGRARLELARHALSRSFGQPLELSAGGDSYSKAFARSGDVHWYALSASEDASLVAAALPTARGLRLSCGLFDGQGRLAAQGFHTIGGAVLMDFTLSPGEEVRIRVSAAGGGVGDYRLLIVPNARGTLADRVVLSQTELTLEGRSSARLAASVQPEDAAGEIYWESSDASVARVDMGGRVTGVSPGTAMISAYAAGGEYARCRVTVNRVAVTGLRLASEAIALNAGDDAAIEYFIQPANASEQGLIYAVEPEGIASVSKSGVVVGLAEGEAVVTVSTVDGGYARQIAVTVGPAPRRWRALLVGEQNYASTVAAVRPGSANSVSALRSMLGELTLAGARFQVDTLLDASRDGVIAGLRRALGPSAEGDVSLFYITCHGYYENGMTCLQMYDGSILTAAELGQALREVRGEVLAVIDCCGSGGVIGRASAPEDILSGIGAVYGGYTGAAALGGSHLRVLASAALEQDSYRISFNEEAAESDMATVFARALCEAGGWSLDRSARRAMRSDVDYDDQVTLDELYSYTRRRVMWYLQLAGRLSGSPGAYVQTVQVWPEGDGTVVFARTKE